MDLHQLRCFVMAADELHFGRAAQRLDMLPSSLSRHIRMLEEDLGVRLVMRTTRNAVLTEHGSFLLEEARSLLARADDLESRIRENGRDRAAVVRLGVIDSAAVGLVPRLLHDFREIAPDVTVQVMEDKTHRILPRMLSGRLDLALIRPSAAPSRRLELHFLLYETAVVALPSSHDLARRTSVSVLDLADQTLIVPERRSRPHSHDLTMRLFSESGLYAKVVHLADEKQTIVNLVAAGMGIAIVPRWASRMQVEGVTYVALDTPGADRLKKLPLAVAWTGSTRDPIRDMLVELLRGRIDIYSKDA
ncbi:LysR family transcriptional regulator [Mesorhizobium sp. Mes31]|uniref:LysR family transcriptional regulator n=1 Tax=Mesorhizobium sp. Mes31 TaxID=2926017 RepID=UPI0021173D3C|nr:LysR family transcriptional regulator [Mesorhizobium sp. Mes31]